MAFGSHSYREEEEWQAHGEGGAFRLGALELDVAAVHSDAALDDEQAETDAGSLPDITAALESLEQSLLVGRGDATAMVDDAADGFGAIACHGEIHFTAFRRILHRVGQQVGEDVSQHIFV